jgi:hypothetical protein
LPDTTKGWSEKLGSDARVAGGDGTDVNLIIYLCGLGAGANLLLAGSNRTIALQPLSLQGSTAINVFA